MRRVFATLLSFVLSFMLATVPVMAADLEVKSPVTNGTITVSDLSIDGVDAPKVGEKLDSSAIVHTREGYQWEIAVVWLTSDGKVATVAKAGETYYPTLAFYIPPKYRLASGTLIVSISDSLTRLLGDKNLVSVFDSSTGLTYILPPAASELPSVTNTINKERTTRWQASSGNTPAPASDSTPASGSPTNPEPASDPTPDPEPEPEPEPEKTLVEIYCSQTATDAIDEDDLEKLISLVKYTLEPQAVNLLIDSFPAFKEASTNSQLGNEIGLYVYYKQGDNDGYKEHQISTPALAYVASSAVESDDTYKYSILLATDVDSLVAKNDKSEPIADETTGKYNLVFEGEAYKTLNYTMIHELFHAFMDDYNRAGMSGTETVKGMLTDDKGYFIDKEVEKKYPYLHFPNWFIEGTASATENIYEFRIGSFKDYRYNQKDGYYDKYTAENVANSYTYGNDSSGTFAYYDLIYKDGGEDSAGDPIDTVNCCYVSGYLATLFLSELAYQKKNGISDNEYVITNKSSGRYREGLNYILESVHNGKTLDEVISEISPYDTDLGEYVYTSADDFEKKFIKGAEDPKAKDSYIGEGYSQTFVVNYLNYMLNLEKDTTRKNPPNGSILYDLDVDIDLPLDSTQEVSSDFYQIAESNRAVASTVQPEATTIGAGKSVYEEQPETDTLQEKVQQAAKEDAAPSSAPEINPEQGADGEEVADTSAETAETTTDSAADVDENAETTKEQDEQAESIPQYSINHEQVYDDEEVADSVENDEISNEKTSDVSEEETRIAEGTTELSDE